MNEDFKKILDEMSYKELIKILSEKMKNEIKIEKTEDNKNINLVKNELEKDENKFYSGFLEGFDKEFDTHMQLRMKQTPILISLFEEFAQDIYKPSKMYKVASTAREKIRGKLESNFSEEQKKLLEQFEFCEDRILGDMLEQAFIYGYAISTQMKEEALLQYKVDKKL